MIIQKTDSRQCRTSIVLQLTCMLTTLVVMGHLSCTPEVTDDPIPYLAFSPVTINLNLPEYQSLRSDGGWKYIDGGVRGIILYRKSSSEYIAYERNCSYQPNNACATVDVHASSLYMSDACCNSVFDFSTGNPTGGPAWRPLNRYETIINGFELTVTSELMP